MMLANGQLLADRYRLTRRIAVGGMGEVWAAEDTRLDRTVAMKVLKPELSGDAEFLHRFRTEARTTASLNHQGVAAVHDYGEIASAPGGAEDTAYLVMELVDGEPMAALVAKYGRLSVEFTLDVLEQSAHALQAAHAGGLVHRDVKPGNIMIASRADGTISVKLTDFGIAKAAHAAPVTRSGLVMGTAHYIAPEQASGSEATPACDVYSLAVCGYECLAGRRPFLADHAVTVAMQHIRDAPPPLPPDIPPAVRALIDIGMAKDPRQRYATGGEFAAAVAAVRAGAMPPPPRGAMPPTAVMPGQTGPVPTQQPTPPSGQYTPAGYAQPPRRGPRPWVWVLIGLVVLAAIITGILLATRDTGGSAPLAPSTVTPTPNGGQPQQPQAPAPAPTTTAPTTTTPTPTTQTTTPEETTTSPSPTTPSTSPTRFGAFGAGTDDGVTGAGLRYPPQRSPRAPASPPLACAVSSPASGSPAVGGDHERIGAAWCAPGGDEDGD